MNPFRVERTTLELLREPFKGIQAEV